MSMSGKEGFREPPPPYSALEEDGCDKGLETTPYIPYLPNNHSQPRVMTYSEPQFGTQKNKCSQSYKYTQQIIVSKPAQSGIIMAKPRSPDYMVPAVLACICCFWPMGACAIYYASKATEFARVGDMEESQRLSTLARNRIIGSIILGIIFITGYSAFIVWGSSGFELP